MRKLLIVILLFLFYTSAFPQTQKELLYKAYQDSSYELLEQFFENWRLEKTPITDEEYEALTEVEKDVYDLFYESYNPFNLEDRRSVYNVIINPKIDYRIIETVERDSLFLLIHSYHGRDLDSIDLAKFDDSFRNSYITSFEYDIPSILKDSILNFRPRVKFNNAGVLYYTPFYDSLLSEFLRSDSLPFNSIDSEYIITYNNFFVSKHFIYPHIYIRRNFNGDFLFLTKPIVSLIVFDRYRTKAKILYSTGDEGRFSEFKRIDGMWKFIKDYSYMR